MAEEETWTVSDDLWEKVEPLIPKNPRDPDRQYKRTPGAGRKARYSNRLYFSAIVYVLQTGIIWNALPSEKFEGITSQAVHKKFMIWSRAGFFQNLGEAGLIEHEDLRGIAWEEQDAKEAGQAGGGRVWRPAIARRNRRKRARPGGSGESSSSSPNGGSAR